MKFYHFNFPSSSVPECAFSEQKPICVVGLIGRSRTSPSSLTSILNSSLPGAQFVQQDPGTGIQCFFDADNSILYLYLERYDDFGQAAVIEKLLEQNCHLSYHQELSKLKLEEIKSWLWLFSVCHFVVLFHPSQSFDVSYIRPFRTAQQLLQHFAPQIAEEHPDTPLLNNSRISQPRFLFVFQSNSASMHLPPKKGRYGFHQQCKRLALEMETQIFHIFRKCRLLPKNQGRGALELGYLPPPNDVREPFVFFMDGKARPSADCPTSKHVDTALYYISQLSATAPQYTENSEENMLLGAFIKRNIKSVKSQALPKKDTATPASSPRFPPLDQWYAVSQLLHNFYCQVDGEAKYTEPVPAKICLQIDPEGQYSENRCQKAFPVATSTYMDALPSHYTRAVHQRQLAHALHILRSRAKGPAFDTYAAKLKEDCDRIWNDAHKGCESVSLTGNACVLPLHDEEERAHSNRLRMRSACSCGRSISYRSDPFNLETANWEFYSSLTEKCCSTLPQNRVFGRSQLSWMICTLGPASSYQTTMGMEQPGFLLGSQFLLPWDLPGDETAWSAEPKNAWRGRRSARCYVGYEYECSKGHRFYCTAGGVPVKGSAANATKENTGGANVTTDNQLYTNCPSHTNKPLLGQLIRMLIVCPEQVSLSLHLTVLYQNILINLTAAETIQIPGGQMTVIRLPYAYCDEKDQPLPFDIDAQLKRNALVPIKHNRRRNNDKK